MTTEEIYINGGFIRLDALLKFSGAAESGGRAKIMITEGDIKVNGETCQMRGKKLYHGDVVEVAGVEYKITVGQPVPQSG